MKKYARYLIPAVSLMIMDLLFCLIFKDNFREPGRAVLQGNVLFLTVVLFINLAKLLAGDINEEGIRNKLCALIFFLALLCGLNAQSGALTNKYVINDDARQHTYWMQQFSDKQLFRNDLLTDYAKNYQTWGFILLYRVFSFFLNPVFSGKLIPVLLLAIGALYLFKLAALIKNNYAGILAALIFIVSPYYMTWLCGGHPRSFGMVLMIASLYYLVKKDYKKVFTVILLESLFYPVTCLLTLLTYFLSFIGAEGKALRIDLSGRKRIYFAAALIVCASMLCVKYKLQYNPAIGNIVTREKMLNNPDYYAGGRYRILPTAPVMDLIYGDTMGGSILLEQSGRLVPATLLSGHGKQKGILIMLIFVLYITAESLRKKLRVPKELFLLFLSGVVMYKIADIFLMRLFLPERYAEYSFPLVGLMVSSLAVSQVIGMTNSRKAEKILGFIFVVFLFLNFGNSRGRGLGDFSPVKKIIECVEKIPADATVAAFPYTADNIPIFAKRKVFVNFELSHTWYDAYWETVKKRTNDLFFAYYSSDINKVRSFLKENKIDYLLVEKCYYDRCYMENNGYYFKPFDGFLKKIFSGRSCFVLEDILKKQDAPFLLIKADAL